MDAVRGLLGKFDVDIADLICGAHWSMHEETMVSQKNLRRLIKHTTTAAANTLV